MKFCPNCGTRIEQSGGRFCPSCGQKLSSDDASSSQGQTRALPHQAASGHDAARQTPSVPEDRSEPTQSEAPTVAVPQRSDEDKSSQHSPSREASDRSDELTHSVEAPKARAADSPSQTSTPLSASRSTATVPSGSTSTGSMPPPRKGGEPAATNTGGGSRKKSKTPLVAAGVLAAVLLGGGAAVALSKMGGSEDAPKSAASSQGGSGDGAAASSTNAADSKPKTMPDLKGRSVQEAQQLLSDKVKIETTKTNLVEGMDGGAVITAQEPTTGTATPDTVKVTIDQPANVKYIDSAPELVVESSPLSSYDTSVRLVDKTYEHILSDSMSGYDSDSPETLSLDLNHGYNRFRTAVGIASGSSDTSKTFTVTIKSDDHQVSKQTLKFNEAPKEIDLDVSGTTRLQIEYSVTKGSEDTESEDSTIAFGDMRVLAEPGRGAESSSTTN